MVIVNGLFATLFGSFSGMCRRALTAIIVIILNTVLVAVSTSVERRSYVGTAVFVAQAA